METRFTRRHTLALAAGGVATAMFARPARAGTVPLPSAADLRRDIKRMVDMGPRYTGTAGHDAFVDWLDQELTAAGVVMLPPDEEKLTIWEATGFGLRELTDHIDVRVATYYPRSQETGPDGIDAPLVYAGTLPAPTISPSGGIDAAGYARVVSEWATGLAGSGGGSVEGSIALVDVPMPLPLTAAFLLPLVTYLNWPGHTAADFAAGDYKRSWLAPGVTGIPTSPFAQQGAVGCVFILDAPYEAIRDAYMPFENGFEELPALFVDRETGRFLRDHAGSPVRKWNLRLEATRREGSAPALLGYLPGTERPAEALIVDSHTDGEGFVEENGGVGMVALARHFATQPLKRSLVFSLWPGHMASGMPQLQGVIDKHPDIVRSAAAAITIEHLGCTEWIDTPEKGYHATGEAEALGVWTTQGKVFDLAKQELIRNRIPHAAMLRPPVQFGVGGAFQSSGVPQVGFLAGPYYLLSNAPGGDMEKFDAALAARQVAWTADMLRAFDGVPMDELAAGDPTLGTKPDAPEPAAYPPLPALRMKLHGARITLNRPALVRFELRRRGRAVVRKRRLMPAGTHRLPLPHRAAGHLVVRAKAGPRVVTRHARL